MTDVLGSQGSCRVELIKEGVRFKHLRKTSDELAKP
jgi:hypothetical protein